MSARPQPSSAPLPVGYDPWAIANDTSMDKRARRRRLRDLAQLVRQMQNATNEGMPPGPTLLPPLDQVLEALHRLEAA